MARFSAAITYRKAPETPVPITAVTACRAEPPWRTWPSRPRSPTANSSESANTIVECPREKKKPTLSGRWPSAISLRVVLSMAAM